MLLYYITDRRSFAGTEEERNAGLLRRIAEAAQCGVDLIQLREKDLNGRALEGLARAAVTTVRDHSQTTRLLVNSRSDVALASGADGVHLAGSELPASEVRALWLKAGKRNPTIGVSAHIVDEVRYGQAHGADFVVLAPIFEKVEAGSTGIGLAALRAACLGEQAPGNTEAVAGSQFTVLALGGVNLTNAGECLAAGAAGIAGIRVFQQGDLASTVRRLRELEPTAARRVSR